MNNDDKGSKGLEEDDDAKESKEEAGRGWTDRRCQGLDSLPWFAPNLSRLKCQLHLGTCKIPHVYKMRVHLWGGFYIHHQSCTVNCSLQNDPHSTRVHTVYTPSRQCQPHTVVKRVPKLCTMVATPSRFCQPSVNESSFFLVIFGPQNVGRVNV